MKKYIYILFIIFFVNVSDYYFALAQNSVLNGLVININPEYPIPNSLVKIKLETYQFDTDVANISWYYNDSLIDSGIGKKEIEIKYPPLGITAKVRVVATMSNGQNYAGGRVLGGSTVNLLYTPIDSYKPAWYEGMSLPAEGGKVKVYAEAYLYSNNKKIPSENLIYNWTINDDPQPTMSGMGKRTSIIDMDPILGELYVEVVVKSLDGIYEAKSSTRISPQSPKLHIYYDDKALFPTHLNYDYIMKSPETMLVAEPYNSLIHKDVKYSWQINGILANSISKAFTMRRPDKAKGQVNININYNNSNKLYQDDTYSGVIYFE